MVFANISWFCDQISKIIFSSESSTDKDANRWKKLFYSSSASGDTREKHVFQKQVDVYFCYRLHVSYTLGGRKGKFQPDRLLSRAFECRLLFRMIWLLLVHFLFKCIWHCLYHLCAKNNWKQSHFTTFSSNNAKFWGSLKVH